MNTRAPSPPTVTRPKKSSSSIASSHAASSSQPPPNMPSSCSTARGATPSASRTSPRAADGDRPARAASKDSLKQKMAKKTDEAPRPSKSDEQLKALRSEFDSLRSHLTCKICDRLLYQPFTIACGHTYCYSCLCTWFVNNKARKTCPDCRTEVNQPPAPAYVIRDMTTVFIGRAELLPSGETIEQHRNWQKEEADAVQQDKDNTDHRTGGLFKGCFQASLLQQRAGHALHPIRDQDDGVDRCPVCSWELEDGECEQCGLVFDDNGDLTWQDSFNGFSDMEEMSEQDMSGEDLDADMVVGMTDHAFDGFSPEDWEEYYPGDGNLMMQRFLQHGYPPRHRHMSHSEAGSRRSYSQSVISDIYTDEMDTVEEEDEDGIDEDSSMNDFLDDEEPAPASSPGASSTHSQTPRPSNARAVLQGRNRRVVESEESSTISSVMEEDEDEEDEGPIRRGQRNRAQTRILNRANGSREASGPPSSTSTDVSVDELDEDTQALLQSEGWMLQHNGPDDQGEEDEDDDSDGGRTTVGWDATAISNDRIRMGGSLTPTADRPRPNGTIRPPSRVGNPLRRRSSVLSSSTVNYEDGEADDDDSDLDQDGDIDMAINTLRTHRSRVHMRNAAAFQNFNNRFANRGFAQGGTNNVNADDNSDNSQPEDQRQASRQTYNPRISRLFADHQRALQEMQMGPLLDLEPRSITPIVRPRTSNRNRPSPAQAYSPFIAPAPSRLRTPNMNNSSNPALNARTPVSPPRRSTPSYSLSAAVSADASVSTQRASSISSGSNASQVLTPGISTPTSQRSSSIVSEAPIGATIDIGDRPPSRVSARPPSATGRRNSAGFSPVYSNFPHTNVGLNIQNRVFPHQALGNPWGAFVQPRGVRVRNSRQVLREQSSTATLRAPVSRVNLREGPTSPPSVRPQNSRIDLRPQPSRRRLNTQSSTRTLRASEHARPPQSPSSATAAAAAQTIPRPSRLTQEETSARARELVNNRMLALGQSSTAPSRNNPFVRAAGAASAPQHTRSNSNESLNSGSSQTVAMTPPSPRLARQRSNRHIGAAPPGVLPPTMGASAYTNNYFRGRHTPLGSSAFELPLNANSRGISPMMATSLI